MPSPKGKLTDVRELTAYVLAHAVGYAWAIAVNPMIFRQLVAQGYREHLLLAGVAISIVLAAVLLLIFLVLRRAMAAPVPAPPPAAPAVPSAKFTDAPELFAYVLAHAAGIAWGAIVTPLIFRSLITQGYHNLMAVGLAMSLAVSVVVLLLFLVLRKAMTATGPA
jgi:hypothetical protein